MATAHHRQPVGMGGQTGKEIGDLEARLPVAAKRPPAGEDLRRARLGELEVERAKALRQRLAGVAGQQRLGIEGVELARAPMHKQRDHRAGPRGEVTGAGSQRVGSQAFLTEHAERRKRAEAEARLGEQVAA